MDTNLIGKYYNKTQVLYRINPEKDIENEWNKIMKFIKNNSITLPLLDQEKRNKTKGQN